MNEQKLREEFYNEFPPKCSDCFRTGVNTYGECLCSYHINEDIIENPKIIADWWLARLQQSLDAERERVRAKIEGKMKQPTQHPTGCPDEMAGCLVYHCEMRFSEQDKVYNQALQDLLKEI